ncbi:MAG: hypothetical protein D6732_25190 [Methanobacteriota archaeon]|nr:MAG: hypothetical protein D6732_25190 [Euryarchaeota archaeon]
METISLEIESVHLISTLVHPALRKKSVLDVVEIFLTMETDLCHALIADGIGAKTLMIHALPTFLNETYRGYV